MFNMSSADLQGHNENFNQNILPPISSNQPTSSLMKSNEQQKDDDLYNSQDSKSETSSKNGNPKSKMFQCTGYGECRMVFTRSEHLARHMRKHTGEKPFQCVVPGCERMFSRFDNMMQHTQTHNKARGPRRTKPTSTKSKRGGKKAGSNLSRRTASSSSSDYDEYGPFPSPPPSRRGSSNNIVKEHQIILPNPKYLEVDEDMDELMSSDDDYDYECLTNANTKRAITSTSRLPDSPASSDSSANASNNDNKLSRRRSAPKVRYHPYPYTQTAESNAKQSLPRRNSALSELATYLVDHPDQSPESYLTNFHNKTAQQSQCLPPRLPTRRLSIQDLSNPIEKLEKASNHIQEPEQQKQQDGVDLTEDEFQAIQGFGKFYKSAITCNK
ncbi:hypothetical protein [Parasitella parasitica]|uniref:C2H2-type domain-containing protein n=1 Tax=Parasitella parasitica TaxID=35722 RepID=A0A0B7N8M0_9FUNG|nr:hypothetical protein [Parasitella parasitica]